MQQNTGQTILRKKHPSAGVGREEKCTSMMMVQKPQSGAELDGYSTKTNSTRLMMTAPHLSVRQFQ
jgi:hypothetical protein